MIWFLGLSLALVVSLYLIAPFLARDVDISETDEITAYREELRALQSREDGTEAEIAILQARLLKAAKADAPRAGGRSAVLPVAVSLLLVSSSLGLYAKLGSPDFEPLTRQQPPEMTGASQGPDFSTLLPRFETQLAENPEDVTGWYLYGRALMLSGQPTAGLRAYERALELSDTPEIRKEYEAAKTYADQRQRGPSADDIAAMQSLSEADRKDAIKGMVASLSARLREAPNDPAGWERLLRSRKVLGQDDLARDDLIELRKALPEQAEAIIARTGWAE
jgi:cytochrome c-type biogenesis protein CcmH/NrfG